MKMKYPMIKTTCLSVLSLSILSACTGVEQDDEANVIAGRRVEPVQTNPVTLVDAQQAGEQDRVGNEEIREAISVDLLATTGVRQDLKKFQDFNYNAARIASQEMYPVDETRENYASLDNNSIKHVGDEPVSTFSIDVDTASYSNVRRFLNEGRLPPVDAVRTEELVNYFSYNYPQTTDNGQPFSVYSEMSASPWSEGKHLLHIGLQAVEPDQVEERSANLVFLVDVSGSMNSPDKLGLLKSSLKMLTRQLDAQDSVSLVVYAGASGVVLEPTSGNEEYIISSALDRLHVGGSTNGAAGIELAYSLARKAFIDGGINRVILATDGDFNVGLSDVNALKALITEKRKTGISLTTLGFGTGNINDHLMEQLADNGNGNYAYIDTLNEARKVLVDEMSSTLQTVAKDVKVQIEFNPAVVAEYRLVGYENRLLNREDFNNDRIDAGEIGTGHTVTALYEISLAGSDALSVDPFRYSANQGESVMLASDSGEFGFLKLRYKAPEADTSVLIEHPLMIEDIVDSVDATSADYRFSAAVAGFAQLLKHDNSLGSFSYDDVLILAQPARGDDAFGYRAEFINMVRTASALN
jgi:Ca-activated chloride channel family protein